MTEDIIKSQYSRSEFLRLCALGTGAVALLGGAASGGEAAAQTAAEKQAGRSDSYKCDMREFVRWIVEEYEPADRVAGGAGHYARRPGLKTTALYGTADMANILYTIGALNPTEAQRAQWKAAFEVYQNPKTGWFFEKDSGLPIEHNTAYALASLQLMDMTPTYPVKTTPQYAHIAAYLKSLNWRTEVYADAHSGAGIGSIYVLARELRSTPWFHEFFATCDSLFDPHNGLMGIDKPASGDLDQVGGTFHYVFLYEYFNRQIPYPKQCIDTVLRLQRPDGYWSPDNHLWMTLDAIYLMTRPQRYCPHRIDDVRAGVRRALDALQRDVYSPSGRNNNFYGPVKGSSKEQLASGQGAHLLTAAISIAAEAQQFLGIREVVTDWPLKLVLDRRPFI